MTPEECARRILIELSFSGPQTSKDKAMGTVLANLAGFAAERDAIHKKLRTVGAEINRETFAPTNNRHAERRRREAIERARIREKTFRRELGLGEGE